MIFIKLLIAHILGDFVFQFDNWVVHKKENKIKSAFLIWPSGYIIGGITKKWQKEIDNDGLEKAGMWIGQLERILTLTFILEGQYQALGFLIAAKSILRISVKKDEERKLTEYVLIGTMLSFSIAIFVGIAINYIIK